MARTTEQREAHARDGWREQTLTRAADLATLARQEAAAGRPDVQEAIEEHLAAARDAATQPPPHWWVRSREAGVLRAAGNLGAAEALLLQSARPEYVAGQLPDLLDGVRRRLPSHPVRGDVEVLAGARAVPDPTDRQRLALASRLISRAHVEDLMRLRSFRNLVLMTAATTTVLAAGLAALGLFRPEFLSLCVSDGDRVCPGGGTAGPYDFLLVELAGVVGAALTAAAGLRGLRGTSTVYGTPVAVALLSLPVGALLAVQGVLLLSGHFFASLLPLPATREQLLTWAAVFGAAQAALLRPVHVRAQQVMAAAEGSWPAESGAIAGRASLPPAVVVVAVAAVAGGWSLWRATMTSGTAAKAYAVAVIAALIAAAGLIAAAQQRRNAKQRAQALSARLERLKKDPAGGTPAERQILLRQARELRDHLTDAGDVEDAAALDEAISATSPKADP